MKSFFRLRRQELFITILTFIFCCFFFTIVDDDEVGSIVQCMAGGQFSNFSFIDFFYLSFVGVNVIYKFLYHILPAFNWMGMAFLGLQYVSLYIVLRTIRSIILRKGYNAYIIALVQILFTFFFIENIITVTHTRFALIFCGVSLFNLVFADSIRKRDILVNTLIFVIGMLHRPESSLGMLILVSSGYLIYKFDPKFLVGRIFFPAFVTVVMVGFIIVDWMHTETYVKKVEPEIEYKLMDNRVIPLSSMKSEADSVKYQLGVQAMWFDPRVITPEFLRSILLPGLNLSPSHAKAVLVHVFSFYKYHLFILPVFFALLLFCLLQTGFRKTGIKILVFQTITCLIIYYLDYNGLLVANRHFLNLQLISLLIIFQYVFGQGNSMEFFTNRRLMGVGFALILSFCIIITIYNYRQNNQAIVRDVAEKERLMEVLESKYSNKTIVVTLGAIHFFDHNFSVKTRNYDKNNYILYDIFTFQLMPVYTDYLSGRCNCDALDPVAFFNWLAKDHALYMSEPWRYDLTEKYMRIIHSGRVKFNSPANLNSLAGVNNFSTRNCQIRTVVIE